MTPEADRVIRDAKRGIKRCKAMNAELRGRIARLERLDHMSMSAASADQLKWLLKMMQAAGSVTGQAEHVGVLPKAA